MIVVLFSQLSSLPEGILEFEDETYKASLRMPIMRYYLFCHLLGTSQLCMSPLLCLLIDLFLLLEMVL